MAEVQKCLHCTLRDAVIEWTTLHGKRFNGEVAYDVAEIVSSLAEVTAEFIEMPADRSQRRRGLRYAHEALDAGVKAVRTGQPQPVTMPTEH